MPAQASSSTYVSRSLVRLQKSGARASRRGGAPSESWLRRPHAAAKRRKLVVNDENLDVLVALLEASGHDRRRAASSRAPGMMTEKVRVIRCSKGLGERAR